MKDRINLLALDVDVLFRVLAIIAVIFLHATANTEIFGRERNFHVVGGSTLLLLISGFNVARFQSKKLFDGLYLQMVMRFFHKIILPYYVVLMTYLLWKKEFDWHSLLLISNYYGRFGSFLEPYWFLELLLQNLILFTGLFSIPPLRKMAQKFPFYFGLSLLFVAILARLSQLTRESELGLRTPDKLIWVYIFGWCLWFAQTKWQKALMTGLILTLIPYLYGLYSSYTIWLVLGSLAISWKSKIQVPQHLHALLMMIGTSTFYIYLVHVIPIYIVLYKLQSPNVLAVVILALLLGILSRNILIKFGF